MSNMVTRSEYLQGLLNQALESYRTIRGLQDKPGDLVVMRQELLKIRGIMQVVLNKAVRRDHPNADVGGLASRITTFLDAYSFEREMDVMEPLYGDDPGRLRHMRTKILESLEDRGLVDKMEQVLSDL